MKWFFALDGGSSGWFGNMIKAAVMSAARNTSLEPHCLYDGESSDLTHWLADHGVTVHFTAVPFRTALFSEAVLAANANTPYSSQHACGAFLRLIAHEFAERKTFLYTDCDVVFLDDRVSSFIEIPTMGAVSEISSEGLTSQNFNSGVMIINSEWFAPHAESLTRMIANHYYYNRSAQSFDQVFLNNYFGPQWVSLPPEFNWRPFQGINSQCSILHFHGPKPSRVSEILKGRIGPDERYLLPLIERSRDGYAHYIGVYESFLS